MSGKFGGFSVVDVHRPPHGPAFIKDLIFVGDPLGTEMTFPKWSQLIRVLRRGCHRVDEASFLVWIGNRGRRWGSHLLVG